MTAAITVAVETAAVRTEMPIKDSKGQALAESVFLMPTLLAGALAFVSLAGVGWLRFELSHLVQSLSACLDSTEQRDVCRQEFQRAIDKLPGSWHVSEVRDSREKTAVVLDYKFYDRKFQWRIDEPHWQSHQANSRH